ncbi:hypothetical protein F1C16_11390 [Hymenobacter sp. NBH84]|uniref:hypothetical protein n=1 Tax=Hymenobacter sp. NBH84 TaxID=2596915 RepID=UPI001626237F|nr:hypothetical protein [Hymenobacter sp. NBH84]QNE40118.1 hypothetical protein F1C16_11390 [Hymenobacter sp. NBH84]
MNAYFVLWPNDWCKRLQKAGDLGPLQVAYGGPHTSVPSLSKVKAGDLIYPVAIRGGELFILGRLQVEHIDEAEVYLTAHTIQKLDGMWDTSAPQLLQQHPALGHRIPRTCVDHVATGVGTGLRFDFGVPSELVRQLQFGPKVGQEKPLNISADSKVSVVSLQGHYRRLSANSAQLIAELMQRF